MNATRSKKNCFDLHEFLGTEGTGRKLREYRRGEAIFYQGGAAESVLYVQKGCVKLSIVNGAGKEAVVAMFGPSDYVGIGCIKGQPIRTGTAIAIAPTAILAIDKHEMLRVLHNEPRLSDHFIEYMLARNIRMEEDLVDQLFNSCEKRLARALLLLAGYGKQERMDSILFKVSQQTLAEMIGTTRSRVNFFMNKFRRLGFIEYNGKITIKKTLLTAAAYEQGSGVFADRRSYDGQTLENFKAQPANLVSAACKKRKKEPWREEPMHGRLSRRFQRPN